MRLVTHSIFAVTAYSLASLAIGVPDPYEIGMCVIGSMLPDIDISSSWFVRAFHLKKVSRWIERRWGHRGLTHSYAFMVMAGAIFSPLLLFGRYTFYLYGLLGVGSHIASDMMTVSGVQLMYPSRRRDVWLGSRDMRIVTGSKAEVGFACVCVIVAIGCLVGNITISMARENLVSAMAVVRSLDEIRVRVGREVRVGDILAENEELKTRTKLLMDKANIELEGAEEELRGLKDPDEREVSAIKFDISQLKAEIEGLKTEISTKEEKLKENEEKIKRLSLEAGDLRGLRLKTHVPQRRISESFRAGDLSPVSSNKPRASRVLERIEEEIERLRKVNRSLMVDKLKSDLAQKEMTLDRKRYELNRLLNPSTNELSRLNSRILSARLELRRLSLQMGSAVVKSPVDGVVRGIKVSSAGGTITATIRIKAEGVERERRPSGTSVRGGLKGEGLPHPNLPLQKGKGIEVNSVVRVVDGDTIVVMIGDKEEKVRYIGVDTPEVYGKVEDYGKEASAFNKELVGGKEVRLEFDVQERDRYGRLLAYVYLEDGRFVNAELVKLGYANVMTIPPNVKYVELFKELEWEAREKGEGLWGNANE